MTAIIQKIFLLCFSSLFLLSAEITLYSACDKEPYSYCENGEVKGINVEIYKAIFNKIQDYSITIKGIKWKEGLKKMKDQKIKMFGSISDNSEKYPFISEYTNPFLYKKQTLLCNESIKGLKQKWPQDFYNLKIATSEDFIESKNFKEAVTKGLITQVKGTHNENFLNLIKKNIDCYIDDEIIIKKKITNQIKTYQENNQSMSILKNIQIIKTINTFGQKIVFSNSAFIFQEDLINQINIAIKIMQTSKEIDKIINNSLNNYLNSNLKKTVNVSVYNWGEYVSDKIVSNGVLAELVEKSYKNQNINITYNFVDSNYAYLLTKWGKSCVSLPWAKTEEKLNYMYFSEPIKPSKTYLFYNKKNFKDGIKYNTLDDLKSYRIGGLNKHFYNEIFKKNNIDYTYFKTLKDAIKALLSNKIDIIPETKEIFISDSKRFFSNELEHLSFHDKNFIDSNMYLLFSKRCKNSEQLRDKFNQGFQNIKQNGVLKKIINKYNLQIEDFIEQETDSNKTTVLTHKNFKICEEQCNAFLQKEKITFSSGTSVIKPENEKLFVDLSSILLSCPETRTNIIGHTDTTGSNEINQKLSLQRAEAVVNQLIKLGINKNNIHAIGKGESTPIASNETKEGQEKNRRIECQTFKSSNLTNQ
ncbi:MAG: Outer membrane protein A [uncultured Sulfurovum sp.]|uniref:Outer membrane protein A n=1 Tax=uncultured Sulfurovum sp. TaxID=269237 RepID=A0A6S6SE06_9BACT|nr:MAG: Outer membrane protein A [uncultured Sulfurovum sp.]